MESKNAITRLLSLDVFRGLTIAIMILVNSPGNKVSYSWLEHSTWNGCTLADLVFPFFIVIVGISSVLALTNLKNKGASNHQLFYKIITRSIYIFMMGLILNAIPHHLDFTNIRIMGVLQRIAICYFFASILFLTTKMRTQIVIIAGLLLGYWFLLSFFSNGNLTIDNNLVGTFDRLVFAPHHLYKPMFDPEGLLSTLPAIASALLGNVAGFCLISSRSQKQKLQWLIISGVSLEILGLIWSIVFPFNKMLWTSSYVLWTSGLTFLVLAVCFNLIEIKQYTKWAKPFALFGKNAMLVYMLHVLFLKIQAIILVHNSNGEIINLRLYITDLFFKNFSPLNASLCYAIAYTLFWLFILKGIAMWRASRKLKTQIV